MKRLQLMLCTRHAGLLSSSRVSQHQGPPFGGCSNFLSRAGSFPELRPVASGVESLIRTIRLFSRRPKVFGLDPLPEGFWEVVQGGLGLGGDLRTIFLQDTHEDHLRGRHKGN